MNWIALFSTALTATATMWSVVLLRRVRDWRIAIPTVVLALLTAGQILQMVGNPVWSVGGFAWTARQLTDLVVSLLAVLGVPLLVKMIASRRRTVATIEESEARLRQIIDLVPHMIFAKDWDSRILLANKALADAYGKTTDELIGVRQGAFQQSAEELAHFLADDRAVMTSGKAKFIPEEPFTDHRGEVRILETTKIPFAASDTAGPAMLGVAVDITERKRATESLQRTLRELDHRVKNTLALVQSIADQTAADAESVDAFLVEFRARVHALRRVHEALREQAWQGVELGSLLSQIVAPYRRDADSIELDGPDVLVAADRVQILGMALHELVANAAKYGAGSHPDGRIRVRWRVESGATGRVLHLEWQESDGPTVRAPGRRGMGLRIIEEGLAYEAGAEAKVHLEPTGVRAEIVMPLDVAARDAAPPIDAPPG